MFFDRVRYTGVQVSSDAFNVTLVSTFNALPATAGRASLFIKDDAGNSAHIDGYRSGTQILVNFIYDSSESDNTMPTFGTGLVIYSTAGADLLRDQQLGAAGIMQVGQSNVVGTDENSKDAVIDYSDPRILEWRNDSPYDNASIASDPLQHQVVGRTNSVGWGMTFAKDLLLREGYNKVCLLASGQGGTGFAANNWNLGDTQFTASITKANAFLAADPNNHIVAIVWSIGEDDSWGDLPGSAAAFEAAFDTACQDMRDALVGNARQSDFSRIPILCTGMTDWWLTQGADKVTVQNALETITERQTYSGFVSAVGLSDQQGISEGFHFDTPGYRALGSRVHPQWITARGLTVALGAPVGTVNATLDPFTSVASGNVDFGSISGSSINTLDDFTSVASGSVVAGVLVDVLYLQNTGLTASPFKWESQVNSPAMDAVEVDSAKRPTIDASGNVQFDGVDDRVLIPVSLFNDSAGYSIMIKIKTGGTGVMIGTENNAFYGIASPQVLRSVSNGLGNLLQGTLTATDDVEHIVYCTVDGSDNTQTIYVDGVFDAALTQGSYATASTIAHLGAFNTTSLPYPGKLINFAMKKSVMSLSEMNTVTAGW